MPRQGQSAWLVTWEWAGDAATVIDRVVAILAPRQKTKRVIEKVECLYSLLTSNFEEQAAYAKNRKNNPYPAKLDVSGHILCGHHPWLRAQYVRNLRVSTASDTGIETISWHTLPIWRLADHGPEKVSEGYVDSFERYITGPVSHEHVWDRMLGRFRDGFMPRPT